MLLIPERSLSSLDTVHHIDALTLLKAQGEKSIDAIVTDLPYGTTACAWDNVIAFEPMWKEVKRVLKPRGVFVTTASQPFTSLLICSNLEMFRYEWIWNKKLGSNFANTDCQPFKIHENVLVFSEATSNYYPLLTKGEPYTKEHNTTIRLVAPSLSKGGITINMGTRQPISIIEQTNANQSEKIHPTQKPVALYEYLIRTYTREGETVLDFCCGSGTTAVAARNTKRHYIVGDSSAKYVAVAKDRLRLPFEPRHVKHANDVSDLPMFQRASFAE